jgi:hypothetical protein
MDPWGQSAAAVIASALTNKNTQNSTANNSESSSGQHHRNSISFGNPPIKTALPPPLPSLPEFDWNIAPTSNKKSADLSAFDPFA